MSIKAKEIYKIDKLEVLADKGYFSNKFKYNKYIDTYTCLEGNTLFLISKKDNIHNKKYRNTDACNDCVNRDKCTKAKLGRSIFRNEFSDVVDEMVHRIETDKT